jgi:hypothetical protein
LRSLTPLWPFLGIFVQKLFDTNFYFKPKQATNYRKNMCAFISVLKVDMTKLPLFFVICYFLEPKIGICPVSFGQISIKEVLVSHSVASASKAR